VVDPVGITKKVCDFLGEDYSPEMLEFHKTATAAARGKQRDHALLAKSVTTEHLGIYKQLLSLRDQRIYAAIAGEVHKKLGYPLDVEPLVISEADRKLWIEWDGRYRAARLDGPGGHIVFESYRDWLVEQRQARKSQDIWSYKDATGEFPIGHPDEEIIVGFRAWKKWKGYFAIKRQYSR
jgi:hypothetical protein